MTNNTFTVCSGHVGIAKSSTSISYPDSAPYLPSEEYPELQGRVPRGDVPNVIYALMRELFFNFGLDNKNFETPLWNPLGKIIAPGQSVLLKPNLVRHKHMGNGDFNAVVTHASVVRCVLDYVCIALKGSGKILVGDAPIQSAHFPTLLEKTGLKAVCENVSSQWDFPVQLLDFRLISVELDERHCIVKTDEKQGDPAGYVNVDLGESSMFKELDGSYDKFRVTSYDCKEMIKHHNHKRHEYLIPRSVLAADVVINLPKLKTHRKVGLTAALKNLVGINGHKDWLPHHRRGSQAEGGDEYLHPSFLKRAQNQLDEFLFDKEKVFFKTFLYLGSRLLDRIAYSVCRDHFKEGSWYGNDTAWRMVLDLNRLLIYADCEGRMVEIPQRRVFTIVDAVVAGDGEGPMQPNARPCGLLVCGDNPLAVDTVLATLVGFDYRKIPLLANAYRMAAWKIATFDPNSIVVSARDSSFNDFEVGKPFACYCFLPPDGWRGHIEFPVCLEKS